MESFPCFLTRPGGPESRPPQTASPRATRGHQYTSLGSSRARVQRSPILAPALQWLLRVPLDPRPTTGTSQVQEREKVGQGSKPQQQLPQRNLNQPRSQRYSHRRNLRRRRLKFRIQSPAAAVSLQMRMVVKSWVNNLFWGLDGWLLSLLSNPIHQGPKVAETLKVLQGAHFCINIQNSKLHFKKVTESLTFSLTLLKIG